MTRAWIHLNLIVTLLCGATLLSSSVTAQPSNKFESRTALANLRLPVFQQRVFKDASEPFNVDFMVVDLNRHRVNVALPERGNYGGASLQRLLFDRPAALGIANG